MPTLSGVALVNLANKSKTLKELVLSLVPTKHRFVSNLKLLTVCANDHWWFQHSAESYICYNTIFNVNLMLSYWTMGALFACDVGWSAIEHAAVSAGRRSLETRIEQIQSHLCFIHTPRSRRNRPQNVCIQSSVFSYLYLF